MKIDKIILNNFRIYSGINEIDFHEKEDKNISIIAGKNGFGKTTFLTSLIWGLYGNQMSQVEEKYKSDIKNTGGYEKYVENLINKEVFNEYNLGIKRNANFSVELHLIDVLIPSIPCKKVIVRRTYNYKKKHEKLSILIDGQENELTREVGYEVFINDFILPREIAKFFFFDAEKIVSLAEAKSKSELRSLSRAYSEVLGIKKYEDLKQNLLSLLTKLKRSGVNKVDKSKLEDLIKKDKEFEQLLNLNKEKQIDIQDEITKSKLKIDELQEKLIREGNEITLYELKEFKNKRESLKEKQREIKNKLKKLLDVVPFVLASKKFDKLIKQIKKEQVAGNDDSSLLLKLKLTEFSQNLISGLKELKLDKEIRKAITDKIQEEKGKLNIKEKTSISKSKVLLDFEEETSRKVFALKDFIEDSFKTQFDKIVNDEKNVRQELTNILRKIKQAEARKGNPLALVLREDKVKMAEKLECLINEKESLIENYGSIHVQSVSNKKILSEYEKNYNLIKTDKEKFNVTTRLLEKLEILTEKIKQEKKYSLEKSILLGLKKLMHKNEFINKVNVRIENDIMDIDLIDSKGNIVDKDSLSKGEQQLYATSLLKALVDESGINFPVFIDSPLQKFDKEHSSNVIEQFYPTISDQVVLFPLLEKELSEKEYKQLIPFLNGVYLIENTEQGSKIQEHSIKDLFTKFNEQNYVFTNKNK